MSNAAQNCIARTKRLLIRPLRVNDEDALCRVFGDAQVMRYSDGVQARPWVREWLRTQVEHHYAAWGFGMWAVQELTRSSDAMGYCGLSRDPKRCGPNETEIGFRLVRDCWGRGLATEAVCVVRD